MRSEAPVLPGLLALVIEPYVAIDDQNMWGRGMENEQRSGVSAVVLLLSARNALITLNTVSLEPPMFMMSARSQA